MAKNTASTGDVPQQPAHAVQRDRAGAPRDQTADQEQRGQHRDVVRGVERRARQPAGVEDRQPEEHEPDVADQQERQQPVDVVLRERPQRADEHGRHREPQHERPRLVVREQQRLRAHHGVEADLGEQPANSAVTGAGALGSCRAARSAAAPSPP
jgi:hypothetical protein